MQEGDWFRLIRDLKGIKRPPNTGCSGPGFALGYALGFIAIMSESKRVSQVRPAAEPIRWAADFHVERDYEKRKIKMDKILDDIGFVTIANKL
jgi:hypothetical protein